jgi:hypothetical protein
MISSRRILLRWDVTRWRIIEVRTWMGIVRMAEFRSCVQIVPSVNDYSLGKRRTYSPYILTITDSRSYGLLTIRATVSLLPQQPLHHNI